MASLKSRVLVTAWKFKGLGTTGVDNEIGELSPVEVAPRLLQVPELGGGGCLMDFDTQGKVKKKRR
jgi:hypothetical protein